MKKMKEDRSQLIHCPGPPAGGRRRRGYSIIQHTATSLFKNKSQEMAILSVLPILSLWALLPSLSFAFVPAPHSSSRTQTHTCVHSSDSNVSNTNPTSLPEQWDHWSSGIQTSKLTFRPPTADERGKGGVTACEPIAALDVLARIPRHLILTAPRAPLRAIEAAASAQNVSWVSELTAATIAALHPSEMDLGVEATQEEREGMEQKQLWVSSWEAGGWATRGEDLGPDDADFGSKCCTGSLLSTGSDNDHNVYAKFRFPCHPVIHRAGVGLAFLTKAAEDDCRDALMWRGKTYRSMRDALLPLIAGPTDRRGSLRERRAWDVADVLSKVLSRVTTIQLPEVEGGREVATPAIVPIHERLAHCDERGENVKVIVASEEEVVLVATRDIAEGEEIARDYAAAPQLPGDESEGALRLLLQFGLPPSAWPKE